MNVKRAFAYSDVHWGLRANSKEWLEIVYDYHKNFLIPFITKYKKDGDILYIGGDIFDSRQSINILVLNRALEIYQELAKLIPIYIILGNHDLYATQTNEINSCKLLSNIPNIHIFEEPVKLNWSGKSVIMMPWRKNAEAEAEFLLNKQSDYLFCHSDYIGAKQNAWVQVEHGNPTDTVKKFGQVWSGHIHWQQQIGNIIFFGSPYQITRSDAYNQKRLWILDFETGTHKSIINTYSPEFIRLNFDSILDYPISTLKEQVKNNFVDLTIKNSDLHKLEVKRLYELFEGFRKFTIQPVDDLFINSDEEIQAVGFNLIDVIKKHVEKTRVTDDFKSRGFTKIVELYNLIQSNSLAEN